MARETIWARRDSPEIILPSSGLPEGGPSAGFSWAQNSISDLCTAAHFGTKPLIFAGVILNNGVLIQQSVNGTIAYSARFQYAIHFTEPGRAEYEFAMVPSSSDALAILTISSGSSSTTVSDGVTYRHPLPRKLLPGLTRVRWRIAGESASVGQSPAQRALIYCMDPDTYRRIEVPIDSDRFWRGTYDAAQPVARCWPRLGNIATVTQNVWVEMDSALDADYLLTTIAHGRPTVGAGYIGEIALGKSGAERVQARVGGGRIATTVSSGGVDVLEEPILAYRGERLSCRLTSSAVAEFMVAGRKL